MKKPCILRILLKVLEQQSRLAEILATPHVQNLDAHKQLRDECNLNLAEFRRLVPEFQLQIEPRKGKL